MMGQHKLYTFWSKEEKKSPSVEEAKINGDYFEENCRKTGDFLHLYRENL